MKTGKAQLERYMRGNLPTQLGNACNLVLPPDGTLHYEYEDVVVDVSVRAEGPLLSVFSQTDSQEKTTNSSGTRSSSGKSKGTRKAICPAALVDYRSSDGYLSLGADYPSPGDEAIGLGLLLAP